jgi:hypothetical protein
MPGSDVLAGDRADSRGGEPLAQPTLGIRVLAGPLPLSREAVRGQVERDQIRAAERHVGGGCFRAFGDFRQLGGQLLLRRRAILVPDPWPATLLLAGG